MCEIPDKSCPLLVSESLHVAETKPKPSKSFKDMRLTEWIFACDWVRHRTCLTLAYVIDSNNAELVVRIWGESR